MNSSPYNAWSRASEKYSPSRSVALSPVIQTQGHVLPVQLLKDELSHMMTWLLNTSEEQHYQNILEMLSLHDHGSISMTALLKRNRVLNFWPNILDNFVRLGEGAFGVVYKASDINTNQIYAIKQLKATSTLYDFLVGLLERNAYVRANESAFVVKLCGAFQGVTSKFLVLEYCIGDLSDYIGAIYMETQTFMDEFISRNFISMLNRQYKTNLDVDIQETAFIYAFELLAGLDYLARRNLIHRDFKPANILISTIGHLKIGDLGLTQRLRWIDRITSLEMVEPYKLKAIEQKDLQPLFVGNIRYSDPESLIYNEVLLPLEIVYKNIKNDAFPLKNVDKDFLTDLYSVSLIIMELLFMGMNFIFIDELSDNVANLFGVQNSSEEDLLLFTFRCIYDEEVRINYLFKILNNQMTEENKSLIEFMKSCYRPKRERALPFTRDIKYYRQKLLVTNRCIDIEKIESLEIYKSRNITTFNVNRLKIEDSILNLYIQSESEIKPLTFKDFQKKVDFSSENIQGIQISSFPYVD